MTALRRHPVLRWSLIALASLLLLLALLVTAAFHSKTAFRFALETAEPFIPGDLRYEELNGTLAGPVETTNVLYEISGTRIRADRLSFDLSPWALLRGGVDLDFLHAEALRVTLAPSEPSETDAPPPRPQEILNALALPVRITIDDIRLEGLDVVRADETVLLQIDRLHAALDWNEQQLALTRVDADGPPFDLGGDLVLGLAQDQRTRLDLAGTWQVDTFLVRASVHGEGDAQSLDVAVELEEPARATLNARFHDLLNAPGWEGSVHVASLRPSAFGETLPETEWSGEFRFDGDWQDTHIEGSARGGWPPATGIHLALDALVNAERVHVDAVDASVEAFGTEMTAQGEVRYADGLSFDASGSFTHFAWPGLEGFALRDARFDVQGDSGQARLDLQAAAGSNEPGRLSIEGGIAFSGTRFNAEVTGNELLFTINGTQLEIPTLTGTASGIPADYRAALEGRVRVNDLPPARFDVQANGDLDHLAADIRALHWLNGSAHGEVNVAWREALQLDARLQGEGFETGQLDPQLAGEVGGRIGVHANLAGKQPDVSLHVETLDGRFAGKELAGSGSLRFANGRIATQDLAVSAGDARLELDDAATGFDFRLAVPALDVFHPELAGSVQASGHFEGELTTPTFRVHAKGKDVSWQGYRAGSFDLEADVARGGLENSFMKLAASTVETPSATADVIDLELRGERSDHELQLNVRGAGSDGSGEMQFAVRGGLHESEWRGDITQLHAAHSATGAWQLADPHAEKMLVLGTAQTQVPEHCLQGPSGRACIGPLMKNVEGWSVTASLQKLPVGVVAAWLPSGLDYTGDVSGELRVDTTASGLDGNAEFRLTRGGIRQDAAEGAETLLGWESGHARVNFDNGRAQAELDIDLLDGDSITGNARLEMPQGGEASIDAELHAAIDNLQLLPSLLPELSALQGQVLADLYVTGPLNAPRVRGEARLQDARARILALGTDWEDVNLELVAEGREVSMTGSAKSGDGRIDVDLDGRNLDGTFSGKARLTGENFRALQTPEATVDITPRLNVALRGRDLFIDGEVIVPHARIEPRDLSTADTTSGDQVIVNAEDGAADDAMRVHVAVTTRLGEDVRVDALGLKARMAGELTVSQQPGNPAIGNGRLVITEGEYTAYGQDLTLARGEIIYTGQPLSNPGLDIRAEREPQPDIMVGVAVRGPLSQPTTNIYSDPPMSETAALAYLLFGRSIEETTGQEAGQVSEAAVALGLGGQRLLGNVGRRFGVEEVRVQDVGDRERASLVLGKYLSPDLYVSYGIGLFDAVNSFRLRYRLSSKWTLEATSGLDSSADFLYTIER